MPSFLVPNEDGVLVLAKHMEEGAPLSPAEEALSLAVNEGGGSGAGMSHYSSAARCGRRARLSAERYQKFRDEKAALPPTKNHFIVGSVYHKLHELARRPSANLTLDLNERFENPSVAEGVRLYKGWMRHWSLDFWGRCLDVEVHLEDDTTFELDLEKLGHFGTAPITVTGAMDMVVEMDAEACQRAKRRGLELTPGRRIVDWKTADAPSDGSNYAQGLQTLWYPYLWNLHFPETPVDGIIYDCIYKRGRRKDRSVLTEDFGAYYFPAGMESVDALRGMVLQGHRNIVEDIPNRAECCDWRGQVCPFRTSGDCDAT